MQRVHSTLLFVTLLASLAPRPLIAQLQQATAPRTMAFTTASEEARTAAYQAAEDFFNIHPTRAAARARQALALDSAFGMARAIYAWSNPPELNAAQREQELNRAVADAARQSTAELLAATTIRAIVLNRAEEARVLIDALIAYLPDDPVPPYLRATREPDVAKRVEALAAVTRKFPDFAPAYNMLAYQRGQAGDNDGAFRAVQEYVRLEPDHPNSHDSYAELLQFAGRLPEAMQHYQRSMDLDPSFGGGALGLAEVHMLMGHPQVARDAYLKAAEVVPTPVGKLNARASAATMYVLEGKLKEFSADLNAVAMDAERQNYRSQAAAFHRTAALAEAVFGNRREIAAHLAKAAELGGAETAAQHRFSALAYAAAGQLEMAKAAAEKYDRALANGTAAQRNTVNEVNAVIAAAEKDFTRARSELSRAGASVLSKAMLADALAKSGNKTEAQTLKAEIMAAGTATTFDVLARAKVRKL